MKNPELKLPKFKKHEKSFLSQVNGKLCFAFDFGEYATKIAVASVSKKKIDIKNMLLVEHDDKLYQLSPSSLPEYKKQIQSVLQKAGLSTAGNVGLVTVNSRKLISRRMEVPYASDEDRDGIVAFEMSEDLALNIDDYYFQHKVDRVYEKNDVQVCSVWAAALAKETCDTYARLLEELRLKPLVMDVDANSVGRILTMDPGISSQVAGRTFAVIDYGMRGTEVSIYQNGVLMQTSNIDLGDRRLVDAAKAVLGNQIVDIHNQNKLIVPPQEIYGILHSSLTAQSENARVFTDAVEEWLSEINAIVKRYNLEYTVNPIDGMLLYGGSLQLGWLKAYLEKYIRVPTSIVSSASFCSVSKRVKQTENMIPQFLNTLGLFLMR